MKNSAIHKIYSLLIFIVFLNPTIIYSNKFEFKPLLDSAISAYQKKDFNKALNFYHQIVDSGLESANLYYNMGNAYFRINELAKAILYYERAKLLNPKDPDIQHNLKYANAFISDKINELPEAFYLTWFRQFSYLFTTNTWAWLSISLFILFLTLIYLYFLSYSFLATRIIKITAFFVLILWIISISTAYYSYKQSSSHKYAIIISDVVEIKSSPDENSTSLFVLHEGTKVYIKEVFDEWLEIKIADGNTGWLKKSNIEQI